MDDTPIMSAKIIMLHSTRGLAKNPKPNNGKLVNINGTIAQCMAHNVDAVMPILSSFVVNFADSILQI